jgi:hypothetical protein
MTDRPIIFSAPMVRALLDGRKTMTRRIIKPQPVEHDGMNCRRLTFFDKRGDVRGDASPDGPDGGADLFVDYHVGDRLWVRETVRAAEDDQFGRVVQYRADDALSHLIAEASDNSSLAFGQWWLLNAYRSNDPLTGGKWVPPIHMPRWASRLTLIVESVKVERLQDISEEDARAEGVEPLLVPPDGGSTPYNEGFRELWDSINAKRAPWESNPWVVALAFSVIRVNIDSLA